MDNFRGIVTMILFVDQKLFVSFSILEIIRLILKWNRRLIVRCVVNVDSTGIIFCWDRKASETDTVCVTNYFNHYLSFGGCDIEIL